MANRQTDRASDMPRAATPKPRKREPGHEPASGARRSKSVLTLGMVTMAICAAMVATAYTDVGLVPGLDILSPSVRFGLPVVRVLLDLAALATLGMSVLPKLVGLDRPAHTESIRSIARRGTVIAALLWMLCALLSLILRTAELRPGKSVTTAAAARYVAEVPAGLGLACTMASALLCIVVGLFAVRYGESVPAELRVTVAILGLLPMPLTGHVSNWSYHDLSVISIELHVVAAALWVGGLAAVAVFVAPRRGLLASTLPRFSALATVAICTVGVSGLFNGLMELALTPGVGIPGLITTGYGHIVLVKIGCLGVLAALGGHARFRLLPRIVRHQRSALVGWAAVEVSIMSMAYGLGAVLARAPVLP